MFLGLGSLLTNAKVRKYRATIYTLLLNVKRGLLYAILSLAKSFR